MPRSETVRRFLICCAAAALPVGAATPSLAHHSYSMFDRNKTVTITGAIRTWEMVNPHSYLWVNVRNGNDVQVWGLEGGGIAALQRAGVTKSSVKPLDCHPPWPFTPSSAWPSLRRQR